MLNLCLQCWNISWLWCASGFLSQSLRVTRVVDRSRWYFSYF